MCTNTWPGSEARAREGTSEVFEIEAAPPRSRPLDNTRAQPRPPHVRAPARYLEVGHRARTCTGGRARVDLCTREEAEGFSEVMARWWREAREVAASPMLSAEKHGHRVDVAETT